jgi:BCD family chlorophyll transporter-like MFS transporter
LLNLRVDPQRIAAVGALLGIFAFAAVVFADPLQSALLFRIGTFLIGVGSGLFSVCMLIAAMELDSKGQAGLALGAWGAVQASAAGIAVALGGAIRDIVSEAATSGLLGPALTGISTGYGVVYHLEIALLFATLVAIGPLVRTASSAGKRPSSKFGLAEFPG